MKNKIPIILLILGIVVILGGCYFAYRVFMDKNKAVFAISDYPKVDASTATHPLADAFYQDFTNDTTVFGSYNKTHQAYVRLINKEVDLILVTEPSEEELALAKDKGMELEVIPVVNEAFVFFVNTQNKVDNLTLKQIQDIYSGKTKNWQDIGGDNEKIKAYQRPVNSGSQTGMLSLVMKETPLMNPPKEDIVESMEAIIGLVSNYDNAKNAIGYSYYYYATTMYDIIDSEITNKIKFIGVDGVKPNKETIKNGSYKLKSNYYIVIDKASPKDSKTRKLVEAMLSERGQKVAEAAGYVGIK